MSFPLAPQCFVVKSFDEPQALGTRDHDDNMLTVLNKSTTVAYRTFLIFI